MVDQNQAGSPVRHRKLKLTAVMAGILAVVIIGALWAIPRFVSSPRGRAFILSRVNAAVDGKADVEDVSMTWLGGITARKISFTGHSGWSQITVDKFSTRPHYASILTGGLSLGHTVIESPDVRLDLAVAGGPGEDVPSEKPSGSGAMVLPLKAVDLEVRAGKIQVNGPDGGRCEIDRINSSIALRRPGRPTVFDLSMVVADGGTGSTVAASGTVTPAAAGIGGYSLEGTSGDIAIQLDALKIGSLAPLLAAAGIEIQASGTVSADMTAVMTDGRLQALEGTINAGGLNVHVPSVKGGNFISDGLDGAVKLHRSGDVVNIERLDLQTDWLNVKVSGTLPATVKAIGELFTARSRAEVKASVVADLPAFFANTPISPGSGVEVTGGRLQGNLEAGPATSGRRVMAGAVVQGFSTMSGGRAVSLAEDLRFDLLTNSAGDRTDIEKFVLTGQFGTVAVQGGTIDMPPDGVPVLNLPLEARLDLARAGDIMASAALLPEGLKLAGLADAMVKITGSGPVYNVSTEDTRLQGLEVRYPGREPFGPQDVTLRGKAQIDTLRKSIKVDQFELNSPQIKIRKASFNKVDNKGQTAVDAKMDFECDLQAVSSLASGYIPPDLKLSGTTGNTITFSGGYPAGQPDKLPAAMNLKAARPFAVSSASYMGLGIGPAQIPLDAVDGVVRVGPFSAPAGDGRIGFSGKINLGSQPPVLVLDGPVKIAEAVPVTGQLGRELVSRINPVLASQADFGGFVNFQCEKLVVPLGAGQVDKIELAGTVAVEKMKLASKGLLGVIMMLIGQPSVVDGAVLPTPISMQSGVLSYENMQLNLGQYPTNFSGRIFFQDGPDGVISSRPDMEVLLPLVVQPGSTRPRSVKIGEQAEGRRIKVPLKSMETSVLARDIAAAIGRQTILGPLLDGGSDQPLGETIDRTLENLKDIFK